MSDERGKIPSAVARQLRQEAGFGCCRCGHPFIQYHHIIPWAEDQHYRPEDMMTLCGQCHPLATVGAATIVEQRKWKSRPKNIVDNKVKGTLWVTSKKLIVNMGSSKAVNTPNLLQLGSDSVLRAALCPEDGRVLISANIQNASGKTIAQIVDNEWSMAPGDVWDFDVHERHAKIRTELGNIAFSIDTRNDEVNMNGNWKFKGRDIKFSPTDLYVGNSKISTYTAVDCGIFIQVD